MLRASCSYLLYVKGSEATARNLHSTLEYEDIVPSIFVGEPKASPDGGFSTLYELAKDIGGSMDQWMDASDTFRRLSEEFPDAVIELQEECVEPYTPTVYTTFKNGVAEEKYGRKLDPDELDTQTIAACTDFLRKQGFSEIADMVEKNLKD